MTAPKLGHGDHWLAVFEPGDPRLPQVLDFPLDAGDGIALHRRALTATLDLVQVTAKRRLVTAYPEPRATALHALRPRSLELWETGAEGWLTAEHEGAGALTFFLTDLAENAERYQKIRGATPLELAALALTTGPAKPNAGAPRLRPAREQDARFHPDEYAYVGEILAIHPTPEGDVLDLALQNGLTLPLTTRETTSLHPGDHTQGLLWLTGRMPEE